MCTRWLYTNTWNKESRDIQPTRAQPLPPPHLHVQCWKHVPATFSDFQHCIWQGEEGIVTLVLKYGNAFRRSAQIFDNYEFCITVPRCFVQDCSYPKMFNKPRTQNLQQSLDSTQLRWEQLLYSRDALRLRTYIWLLIIKVTNELLITIIIN